MGAYDERLQRTLDAIHMEKVDKIPYSYGGSGYLPVAQGMKVSDYLSDYVAATSMVRDFLLAHPGIDTIHKPTMNAYGLSVLWLSKVAVLGVDIGEDEGWQVLEQELMTVDDYQKIVDEGYGPWVERFMREKVNDPIAKLAEFGASLPVTVQRLKDEAQVPVVGTIDGASPIEAFCGARQLENFFIDSLEEPRLVKKAMDNAFEYGINAYISRLENEKPIATWIGGWRGAPQLMSHEMWEEYVWPYIKEYVRVTAERDVIPFLHFDSNWDREIETLKELPKQTCVLMLDGSTDIRRAHDILDDHMAIMGDVPAPMLAYGTPEDCRSYVNSLIDYFNGRGLIVSSGCDCPINAKPENVDAMIQATVDYRVR